MWSTEHSGDTVISTQSAFDVDKFMMMIPDSSDDDI